MSQFFLQILSVSALTRPIFTRSMSGSEFDDNLAAARALFPKLTESLTKGDCGRVGVIGGYREYSGAPFFVALTTIRMGADLTYVFAQPDVAQSIKTFSPEVMVQPTQEFEEIRARLVCLHTIVFGPGLGRDTERTAPLLLKILDLLQKNPQLGLVVDADGLYLIGSSSECVEKIRGMRDQVILTPNAREFEKIYERASLSQDGSLKIEERVCLLANHLKVCIIYKGRDDIITDGDQIRFGRVPGSMRRCGGQGDILSGAIALFAYYAKWRDVGTPTPPKDAPFRAAHFLDGAEVGSAFMRTVAAKTFDRIGRSMTAEDVIGQIASVVREEIDGKRL